MWKWLTLLQRLQISERKTSAISMYNQWCISYQEQCNKGNGAKNALLYVIKFKQGAWQAFSRGGVPNASGVLSQVGLTVLMIIFMTHMKGQNLHYLSLCSFWVWKEKFLSQWPVVQFLFSSPIFSTNLVYFFTACSNSIICTAQISFHAKHAIFPVLCKLSSLNETELFT